MSEGSNSTSNGTDITDIFNGSTQPKVDDSQGITTKAFVLNLAFGFVVFTLQVTGFFLLKSSSIGRRI